MKLIVAVVLACIALAAAGPLPEGGSPAKVPQILRSEFENKEGNYLYSFETENGIIKSENGEVKTVNDEENKPHDVVVVRGSFSYPGADGKPISITYFADETGFHAEGETIPQVTRR